MLQLFMAEIYLNDGGKQIPIKTGQLIRVDYIGEKSVGDTVELQGIRINDDGTTNSETVIALVKQHLQKKVTIFKKKRRTGYERKIGCCVKMTLVEIRNGK